MITHEEARKENNLMMENHITLTKEKYQFIAKEMVKRRTTHYKKIDDYITQQEQFSKDVDRYFELRSKANRFLMENEDELREFWKLEEKLSKVGKE